MQNTLATNSNLNNKIALRSKISNVINKIKDHVNTEYEDQMDAELIINRISSALTFGKEITIQTRKNSYSNNVVNYTGKIFQNINGKLILQTKKDTIQIVPTDIQYIY